MPGQGSKVAAGSGQGQGSLGTRPVAGDEARGPQPTGLISPFWESTGITGNLSGFIENYRYFYFFQRELTSIDKMRFGKCQMDAKDSPNA